MTGGPVLALRKAAGTAGSGTDVPADHQRPPGTAGGPAREPTMSIQDEFDFLIQWHLTERCNLTCRHCYQEGGTAGELSFDEVRQVLDEIDDMFSAWSDAYALRLVPSFSITGGEPLLREDLQDI